MIKMKRITIKINRRILNPLKANKIKIGVVAVVIEGAAVVVHIINAVVHITRKIWRKEKLVT